MEDAMKLGYLVFATRRLERWRDFCRDMLGSSAPVQNVDGSLGYRVDAAAQRLILARGTHEAHEDLAALGFELGSDAALDARIAKLRALGVDVKEAQPQLRAARRVRRLHVCRDPAGNQLELAVGLEVSDTPFQSEHFPAGFETGELGLGHAALIARDLSALERFYVAGLGFGVSERLSTRVGPLAVQGLFLHCNRRHHSLAFLGLPLARRLHHFMLQSRDWNSVGRAFERAERHGVPLSLSLGQHAEPDSTFSFYGVTPSGFEFEIGAGSGEIDPLHWREVQSGTTSAWGHKPTLRLKLQTARALLAHRLALQP